MDFSQIPLFGVVKKKFAWLTQRQEVLAENVANSDTPGYVPKDLKKFEFHELIRREEMQLNMEADRADHLPGRRRRLRDWDSKEERRPYETLPAGNSVILDEQMGKLNESKVSHHLTTELYKKHLRMFRIAIGKG